MSGRRFVDLTVLAAVATATLVTLYLFAIRVEMAYPLTEGEWNSYRLRGNQVQEVFFYNATCLGWLGAAWHFAGRWAERKR